MSGFSSLRATATICLFHFNIIALLTQRQSQGVRSGREWVTVGQRIQAPSDNCWRHENRGGWGAGSPTD